MRCSHWSTFIYHAVCCFNSQWPRIKSSAAHTASSGYELTTAAASSTAGQSEISEWAKGAHHMARKDQPLPGALCRCCSAFCSTLRLSNAARKRKRNQEEEERRNCRASHGLHGCAQSQTHELALAVTSSQYSMSNGPADGRRIHQCACVQRALSCAK